MACVCQRWNRLLTNDEYLATYYRLLFGDPNVLRNIPRGLGKVLHCHKAPEFTGNLWSGPKADCNYMVLLKKRLIEDRQREYEYLSHRRGSMNFTSHRMKKSLGDKYPSETTPFSELKSYLEDEAQMLGGEGRCGDLFVISLFITHVWSIQCNDNQELLELMWLYKIRATTEICHSIALFLDLRMHDYERAEKFYRKTVSAYSYFDFPGGDNSLSEFFEGWSNFCSRVLHDDSMSCYLHKKSEEIRFWT